jgi:hypothetical protein
MPTGKRESPSGAREKLASGGTLDRDFHRQKALNPCRCQRITVSGLMIATASITFRAEAIEPDECQGIFAILSVVGSDAPP